MMSSETEKNILLTLDVKEPPGIQPGATDLYHCQLSIIQISEVMQSLSTPRRFTGGAEVNLQGLVTSVLEGSERSASHYRRFNPGKERRYSFNGRLGGSQTVVEKRKIIFLGRSSNPELYSL